MSANEYCDCNAKNPYEHHLKQQHEKRKYELKHKKHHEPIVKCNPKCYDTELSTKQRSWDARRQYKMRKHTAKYEKSKLIHGQREVNCDETYVPEYRGMFSKTLPHTDQGTVDTKAYKIMQQALLQRSVKLMTNIPQSGIRKLVQPMTAYSVNLIGPSPSSIPMPPPPSISSNEGASEMVELYWFQLFRDSPLHNIKDSPLIDEAIAELNKLIDYKAPKPVNKHNIFRGLGDGELFGPYISQLMYIDTPMWPGDCLSKYNLPIRSNINNRMITKEDYLAVQNGFVPEGPITLSNDKTYLTTPRDLGYSVLNDLPAQWYSLAAKRLINIGAKFSPRNPYLNKPLDNTMESFVNWSQNDLNACLEAGCQIGLTCAWYNKWCMFRRSRPESFGNQVEQVRLTGKNPCHIQKQLLKSNVLQKILELQGNYYLAQCAPEGSPAHPSYPAGHAVFSGVGCTIIKAFLQNDWIFQNPVVPSDDGKTLVPIHDKLRLDHELNKLANNVATGRNMNGFHYRSDGHESILLGEKIAILILQDWIERYPENNASFKFNGYMGDEIVIKPGSSWGHDLNPPYYYNKIECDKLYPCYGKEDEKNKVECKKEETKCIKQCREYKYAKY